MGQKSMHFELTLLPLIAWSKICLQVRRRHGQSKFTFDLSGNQSLLLKGSFKLQYWWDRSFLKRWKGVKCNMKDIDWLNWQLKRDKRSWSTFSRETIFIIYSLHPLASFTFMKKKTKTIGPCFCIGVFFQSVVKLAATGGHINMKLLKHFFWPHQGRTVSKMRQSIQIKNTKTRLVIQADPCLPSNQLSALL